MEINDLREFGRLAFVTRLLPQENAKNTKTRGYVTCTVLFCDLCTAIRHTHACSRGFFLAQRAQRAQRNNRKKERHVQSLFHLCELNASARNSFLPGGFWARLVALCPCSAICQNQPFSRKSGRGMMDRGMWKSISQNYSAAHHSPAHDSPDTSPMLLLPSPSSLGLRLAALCSFAAIRLWARLPVLFSMTQFSRFYFFRWLD